jgi:hypothetical protein
MASRTFDVKFPYDTQLTFRSLTFAVGEDGDLKVLAPGPTSSSTSSSSYVGSGHCAGNYIRTAKIVRGIPIVTSILRPLVGASSSSISASTPNSDSFDDYPEIGADTCREPAKDGRFIYMVALNGDRSSNTSNRYPTIERSEASDVQTLSGGLARNLNPDFNVVRSRQLWKPYNTWRPMTPLLLS